MIHWIAQVLCARRFALLRDERRDLHQEIMMRVFASLREGRFDVSRDFRAYVQAVARYTALRTLFGRGRSRFLVPLDESLPDTRPDPEGSVATQDMALFALSRASEDCLDLLRDYFFRQKDYGEIARERAVPVGTVKSRLVRCLKNAGRLMRVAALRQGS